jgi:hypothetical protein
MRHAKAWIGAALLELLLCAFVPKEWLGGSKRLPRFEYNGEGAGACSGAICIGGTCTGTTPTGTCSLEAGSHYLKTSASAIVGNPPSCIYDFPEVTITAGTVTCAAAGSGGSDDFPLGSALIIRTGPFTMSGGTITMAALGGKGASGGACSSVNAGKAGGSSGLAVGGAAGTSGGTAGASGTSLFEAIGDATSTMRVWPLLIPYFPTVGTGGGACPSSGQTAAASFTTGWLTIGGTGGGGGGCTAACSGTCGRGGRGGGMVLIEADGAVTLTGGTISVAGENGATGGGGGGAAGAVVFVGNGFENTSALTLTTTAGATGGSPPTNCGNGAGGATGTVYKVLQPS